MENNENKYIQIIVRDHDNFYDLEPKPNLFRFRLRVVLWAAKYRPTFLSDHIAGYRDNDASYQVERVRQYHSHKVLIMLLLYKLA